MGGRARPFGRRVDAKQLHEDRKAFRADIFSMGAAAAAAARVLGSRPAPAASTPRPVSRSRSATWFKKLGIGRGFGQYNYGPFEWGPEARMGRENGMGGPKRQKQGGGRRSG